MAENGMKIIYTDESESTIVYESNNHIDVKLAYKDMVERRNINMSNLSIIDLPEEDYKYSCN